MNLSVAQAKPVEYRVKLEMTLEEAESLREVLRQYRKTLSTEQSYQVWHFAEVLDKELETGGVV